MEQIGNAQRTKGAGRKCKKEKKRKERKKERKKKKKQGKHTGPIRNRGKLPKKQPNPPRLIGSGGKPPKQTILPRPITAQKHNPPSPKPRCKNIQSSFEKAENSTLPYQAAQSLPANTHTSASQKQKEAIPSLLNTQSLTAGAKELQRSSFIATYN